MKLFIPAGKLSCLLLCILCIGNNTYSQCANGAEPSTMSYDTIFGSKGNSNYNFAFPQFDTSLLYAVFPQWDPSKGTLIKVGFETFINVKYSYRLTNEDSIQLNYLISMSRLDVISSSVLTSPFISSKSGVIDSALLEAFDGVDGAGTDFIKKGPLYAYNKYPINYNLESNLAGFLGNGKVYFNYGTTTNLNPSGSTYAFSPTTNDSVSFKLTYYYCLTSLLPADIGNFSATKLTSGKIQLSWNSPNDLTGNKYEVQKSTDAKNYDSFETIISKSSAANNYQLTYAPTGDDRNKVFFRIKQFETDGSLKYSLVKAVDLEYTASTMKVYPTITRSDFNIYFPYAAKGDYQVSIVSITGQMMQQTVFNRTNFIKITLNPVLKAGMYIVSVVNKQTSEKQQSKILIQ